MCTSILGTEQPSSCRLSSRSRLGFRIWCPYLSFLLEVSDIECKGQLQAERALPYLPIGVGTLSARQSQPSHFPHAHFNESKQTKIIALASLVFSNAITAQYITCKPAQYRFWQHTRVWYNVRLDYRSFALQQRRGFISRRASRDTCSPLRRSSFQDCTLGHARS